MCVHVRIGITTAHVSEAANTHDACTSGVANAHDACGNAHKSGAANALDAHGDARTSACGRGHTGQLLMCPKG